MGLDLNLPLTYAVPETRLQNPLSSTGYLIYPLASAPNSLSSTPTPQQRHVISHNFVITAGKPLFVADHLLPSDQLCLVRLSLPSFARSDLAQTCIASGSLTGQPSSSPYVSQLKQNAFGELTLSISSNSGKPELDRVYVIDKTTLTLELANPMHRPNGALPIPWQVQKAALISFVAIGPISSDQRKDQATIMLVADSSGAVSEVYVTGLPGDLAKQVKLAVSGWRFKPTILDGKPVRVATEFTSTLSDLLQVAR